MNAVVVAWVPVMAVDTGDATLRLVIAVLITAAVLALTLALLLISSDQRSRLEKRLTGYGLEEAGTDPGAPIPGPDQQLTETKLMQEMVGLTGRLAERVGMLSRVEEKLEQADLPLRPPEAVFLYLAGVLFMLVAALLVAPPLFAVLVALATSIAPLGWLELRRKRRLRVFERQLPDVLNLLSGSMRAGFSFNQGLEAVADEAPDPSARELQRVFAESRLGRSIEDALEDSANRMHSVDLIWAVMAIRIQREVGGNLAELLDTVARTMKERERLKHEIVALTAEGRMSGWVLGIFPAAFGVILYLIQPKYMSMLFSEPIGVMALIASGVMACFGFYWLRRIMNIEV
jgi:tight adherence protein B